MDSASRLLDDTSSASVVGRKLPSFRYKGVVPQPNGRWGAQIYERHQRVWLGTFACKADAARAYDVAAERFRGRAAVTNFSPLADSDPDAAAELRFLASRSKADVVDMLRKHTYFDELSQNKRACDAASASSSLGANNNDNNRSSSPASVSFSTGASTPAVAREHLFDKTMTPSDVGNLNRLVIPKQHAEKHFPLQLPSAGCERKLVLLNLEDAAGKVWRFRYSYWKSSQSFVFTKGWSRFVKEKGLQAGDVVGFYRSVSAAGAGTEIKLFIDCKLRPNNVVVTASTSTTGPVVSSSPRPPAPVLTSKAVRLFGVDLLTAPAPVASPAETMAAAGCKRARDLGSPQHAAAFKKQTVELALV